MSIWHMIRATGGGVMIGISLLLLLSEIQPFKSNPSKSLPKGIYIRTFEPLRVGSLIWFPLPPAMNDYVSKMPKTEAWFARPGNGLLKPVIALPKDVICRNEANVFSVNGLELGTAPTIGPIGHPLPSWQGCKILSPGEVAVFSDSIPDSIDSRLYGAIPSATARVYRLLWLY